MTAARRAGIVAVLILVFAAAAIADRMVGRPQSSTTSAVALAARMPMAAPPEALSSTWFCAGGTANADGRADHRVIVANTTAREVTGTLTAVPVEGDPVRTPITVGGRSRQVIRVGDFVQSQYAAATVDLNGGGVGVEHEVSGPAGASVSPCAATGSGRWYVADGSTARDNTMLLALFNPFPEDAIVDLAFSTDQGRAVPADFQGVVVRGGRLAVIDVGSHVRRRDRVAATVATRSGRLVVDKLQFRGGSPQGLSLMLAAPSRADSWSFADGYAGDGIVERFSVYNPSPREAVVSLDLVLDGEPVEPFDLTVPANNRVDLIANDEERVPKNTAHSATVTSLNGIPIVAERSIVGNAARVGVAETLGARVRANRWLLAAGAATDTRDEWLSVLNDDTTPVQVSVTVLAAGQPLAVDGLQDITVGAGKRASFRLTDHIKRDDTPLVVEATGGRVVVERAIYYVGSPGVSLTAGIPLRSSASFACCS